MQQVAPATRFNKKQAHFVSPVHDPLPWAVDALSLPKGGSGPICLLINSHLGQSGGEVAGLPVQENYSDCTRVAQHALVLGSSDYVQPDPTGPAQGAHSTIQADST